MLREGLAVLPASRQREVRKRAQAYRADARMPCPLLDGQGSCSVYAHRPRICRKYGIVLWSPEDPGKVTTCPKNFQGVTDIDAQLVLDPQAQWAQDWIRLRGELHLGPSEPTTIAEQLLLP